MSHRAPLQVSDHFPFWWPALVVIVLGGSLTVLYAASLHYTTVTFGDVAHQRRECAAMSDMAADVLPRYQAINAARARERLTALRIGFNPVLRGVSSDGAAASPPAFLPAHLRGLILVADPLDCRAALAGRGLSVFPNPLSIDEPRGIRIGFSRIVFSADGRYAYAELGETCGNICGVGRETRWRLKDGHWRLEQSRQTWVS